MEKRGIKLGISSPTFEGGCAVLSQNSAPSLLIVQEERKKRGLSAPHQALKEGEGGKEGNGVHTTRFHHLNDVFLRLRIGTKAESKGEYVSYQANVVTV